MSITQIIETKIAGVFSLPSGKQAMKLLLPGDAIGFESEPGNAHDKNAVALFADDADGMRKKIGYLPKSVAAAIAGKNLLKVEKTALGFDAIQIAVSDTADDAIRIEAKAVAGNSDAKISVGVPGVLDEGEVDVFRKIQAKAHALAVAGGWWSDVKTGERIQRNKGELLMLMVSEIAEAMEGERKNKMDDKLPHRKMAEVELADCVIRIMDYAGAHGYDVAQSISEKMFYNSARPDHKPENRAKEDGKKF